MNRRKRVLQKRRKAQRKVDETNPGVKLIFAEGYAAVKGKWKNGEEGDPPLTVENQP